MNISPYLQLHVFIHILRLLIVIRIKNERLAYRLEIIKIQDGQSHIKYLSLFMIMKVNLFQAMTDIY